MCHLLVQYHVARTSVADLDSGGQFVSLLAFFAFGGSSDLVRVASGASAFRMPIAYSLQLLVSSRDGLVFSVLPRTSYYVGISSTIHCSHIFLFSVGVRLLSDLFRLSLLSELHAWSVKDV